MHIFIYNDDKNKLFPFSKVQKQSMLSHTAQDSQALWEEELKSRSKLGLRLAELEKEKGELSTQVIIVMHSCAGSCKCWITWPSPLMIYHSLNPKSNHPVRSFVPDGNRKEESQENSGAEKGCRHPTGSGDEEKHRSSKRNVQVTPFFLLAPSSPMAVPPPTV